jgi:SAM-dependent methyltransferase
MNGPAERSGARPDGPRYLTAAEIRADFDRIAREEPEGSGAALGRHAWIERHLPPAPARALDLGCGTGELTRLLARRCREAIGVDLSGAMIERARADTPPDLRATYLQGDFRDVPAPGEEFDVVTAVAALHHLPIAEALALAAARVRPGGILLVVDLLDPRLPRALRRLAAFAVAHWDLLAHGRPPRRGARAAWNAHGDRERLPTAREVRAACAALDPPGRPRFHVRWRWTLAWRAPAAAR